MNFNFRRIPAPAALAALSLALAPPAVAAGPVDAFLSDVKFESATKGAAAAIAKLDQRLEKGGLSAGDAAAIQALRGSLVAKVPGREEEGAAILEREVIFREGVDAGFKLSTARNILGIYAEQKRLRPPVVLLRRMLDLPEFKSPPAVRADLYMRLGAAYANRSFNDTAIGAYRDAAKCYAAANDPARQADALLAAGRRALVLRDVPLAQACYREALAIPGLDNAKTQLVKLRIGESQIFADQYGWEPTRERVAAARATIEDALAISRVRVIPIDHENNALLSLLRAEAQSGNYEGAIEIGRRLIDDEHRTIDKKVRANVAAHLGDYFAALKKPKEAIRYYEASLASGYPDCGGKTIHYRIANVARASKDYSRAMQAYSDAIGFCDRVEGKKEIERLQRLAGEMNRLVGKKDKGVEAEDIFRDGGDAIGTIQLDER